VTSSIIVYLNRFDDCMTAPEGTPDATSNQADLSDSDLEYNPNHYLA
jgi:hypothetical protein